MITWFKDRIWQTLAVIVSVFVVYGGIADLTFTLRHPWATSGHKLYCALEMFTFQHVTKQDCGETP